MEKQESFERKKKKYRTVYKKAVPYRETSLSKAEKRKKSKRSRPSR